MSLSINKQLLSIIDTMENADTILLQLLSSGKESLNDIISLLTEYQNCAIEIGTKIEKVYGDNFKTVSCLETYCECVYELAESLNTSDTIFEKHQQLCNQLRLVRTQMEKELPKKKEIVFLPYKASMWDSLESIYLAAMEEEDCDAYCVPIPYFEKNPDGSFSEMHYEIKEYPPEIEVIDYRDYDFKERRPDAIYIHNPYDNWNHVTSVHPDFYAKNLRNYTDELVYIPYFVLGEINPGNQISIDGIKHFCFLPGTIYANKIILQSEGMKQIYINEFIKAAAENGLSGHFTDRKIQEERFLGTGSPKFDKIKRTTTEEISIPGDWLSIIEKADGTKKKIVLYNTTIASFLTHKEHMLEKIKDSLYFFSKEQEEITLLWRPHPLMENTIKSMHPELLDQYLSIVNQYKQEHWGIYDDTSDLNRAIAISDCYYGDHSSVVQLYKETGKPIMIQNVNILYNL